MKFVPNTMKSFNDLITKILNDASVPGNHIEPIRNQIHANNPQMHSLWDEEAAAYPEIKSKVITYSTLFAAYRYFCFHNPRAWFMPVLHPHMCNVSKEDIPQYIERHSRIMNEQSKTKSGQDLYDAMISAFKD